MDTKPYSRMIPGTGSRWEKINDMHPKIEQFLLQLNDHKRPLAAEVREIFLAADKNVTEAIKWKQLTFVYGKTNIAFIYTFPGVDYINVGFFAATSLTDKDKLFEGTGDKMRHIKIRTSVDIPHQQLEPR